MKSEDDFMTSLLMVCVSLEFIVAEAAVAVTVWKHPNPNLPGWLVNAFTVSLVACLPAVMGLKAHSIIRRLVSVDEVPFLKVKLSRILLAGIGGAYAAMIVMIIILS